MGKHPGVQRARPWHLRKQTACFTTSTLASPRGSTRPLIFLGIGAMTDFSTLLARPVLMLLGAAAQAGIFITFLGALALGFEPHEAASHWHHRRCRRDPRPIFLTAKTGPHTHRTHCRCSLLLHGPCSGDPAADHAASDHQTRAAHPHGRAPGSDQNVNGFSFPLSPFCSAAFLAPAAPAPPGHALFRQTCSKRRL